MKFYYILLIVNYFNNITEKRPFFCTGGSFKPPMPDVSGKKHPFSKHIRDGYIYPKNAYPQNGTFVIAAKGSFTVG